MKLLINNFTLFNIQKMVFLIEPSRQILLYDRHVPLAEDNINNAPADKA